MSAEVLLGLAALVAAVFSGATALYVAVSSSRRDGRRLEAEISGRLKRSGNEDDDKAPS